MRLAGAAGRTGVSDQPARPYGDRGADASLQLHRGPSDDPEAAVVREPELPEDHEAQHIGAERRQDLVECSGEVVAGQAWRTSRSRVSSVIAMATMA
jgi:hypothetical protein